MGKRTCFLFVLAALALTGNLPAAATCSADAYAKACSTCSFDPSGKMNQSCYNGYIDGARACLFASYPVLATSYEAGKCPEVALCINNLDLCKGALSSYSDKQDCNVAAIKECYSDADKCVEEANKKCDVKVEDIASACQPTFFIGLLTISCFVFPRD